MGSQIFPCHRLDGYQTSQMNFHNHITYTVFVYLNNLTVSAKRGCKVYFVYLVQWPCLYVVSHPKDRCLDLAFVPGKLWHDSRSLSLHESCPRIRTKLSLISIAAFREPDILGTILSVPRLGWILRCNERQRLGRNLKSIAAAVPLQNLLLLHSSERQATW